MNHSEIEVEQNGTNFRIVNKEVFINGQKVVAGETLGYKGSTVAWSIVFSLLIGALLGALFL